MSVHSAEYMHLEEFWLARLLRLNACKKKKVENALKKLKYAKWAYKRITF